MASDKLLKRVIAGKYTIESKLGEGGMGAVYHARHRLLDQDLVVKVMRPQLAASEVLVKRFMIEAQAATAFVHRHAVPVRDFGIEPDGLVYMTMDLAPGESLLSVIRRRRKLPTTSQRRGVVPWEWSLPIVEQLLDVLRLAHERGIVHRDLKPDNIMVDLSGNRPDIQVLDFGIAKILTEAGDEADKDAGTAGLTQAGSVIGTLQYMAPEQATGDRIDARADLYAVGVILYQMATGRLPIDADTMAKLIYAVTTQPPVPLREAAPHVEVPDDLTRILAKALAKAPEDRYASAGAFLEDVSALREKLVDPAASTGAAVDVRAAASVVDRGAPTLGADAGLTVSSDASDSSAPTLPAESLADVDPTAPTIEQAPPAPEAKEQATAPTRPAPPDAPSLDKTIEIGRSPATAARTEADELPRRRGGVLLVVLLLLAVGGAAAWFALGPSPYEQTLTEARRALKAGHLDKAEKRFRDAGAIRKTEDVRDGLRRVQVARAKKEFETLLAAESFDAALGSLAQAADSGQDPDANRADALRLHTARLRSAYRKGNHADVVAAADAARKSGALDEDASRIERDARYRMAIAGARAALRARKPQRAQERLDEAREFAPEGGAGEIPALERQIRFASGASAPPRGRPGRRIGQAIRAKIARHFSTFGTPVRLEGHRYKINAIAIHPQGKHLASSGGDIRVWDLTRRSKESRILHRNQTGGGAGLAFSPDGTRLIVGDENGYVLLFEFPSGRLLHKVRTHTTGIQAVAVGMQGNLIAAGSARSGEVRLLTGAMQPAGRLPGLRGRLTGLAISPRQRLAVATTATGGLRVWRAPAWELGTTYAVHRAAIDGAAFHPASAALVTASRAERRISVRDARDPKQKVRDVNTPCGRPQFSADGRLLLVGIHLLDASDWKHLATAPVREPAALAPDGSGIAGVHLTDEKDIRYVPIKK